MFNPELQSYISSSRASGMSDQEIKSKLLESGWNENDVDEYLLDRAVPVPEDKRPRVVSQWIRLSNHILDSIFFITLSVLLFPPDNRWAGIVVGILYYLLFEGKWQRTPAKFITRTKVVAENGLEPNFKSIIGRTFARLIPLDNLSFLFGRGWHDGLSKTLVVPNNYTPEDVLKIDPKAKKNISVFLVIVVIFLVFAMGGIFVTTMLVSLQSSRNIARDAKRVADVKIITSALELYYVDNKRYPSQLSELEYIVTLPSPAEPPDGDCTMETNRYRYILVGNNYSLSFCLGEARGGYNKGVNMVRGIE